MACGCSDVGCQCIVQGGTGTTVQGSGTPGDPYVINAGGAATTVQDTNSVDMTITGAGTTGSPYVIKSDVIRDPAADNILTIGPNGVGVSCEAVQDCVGAGFTDGLEYDDAANEFHVKISTDGGNITNIGTDGGVFTPSTPVALGCGLTNDAFGAVAVDGFPFASLTRRNCGDTADSAGTTPLLPGCELEGMEVYCDSQGQLRTKPEKMAEAAAVAINEGYAPAITALPFTTTPIQSIITNPSDCYCMCGYLTVAVIPAISGVAGTVIQIAHEVDFGIGGGFVPVSAYVMDNRGKTALSGGGNFRMAAPLNICLDPGESKTIQYRATFSRFTGDNGGAVTISAAARDLRFFGSNL